MKTRWICSLCVAAMFAGAPAIAQQQGSAAAGSGGTAATNGTSASSLGAGATTTGPNGDASALGMGASAAGPNATSRSGVHGNNNLNGQSMAMSHDQGTMSKSHTICHDKSGNSVDCKTMTMSHEPGEKPEKSTSEGSAEIPQP